MLPVTFNGDSLDVHIELLDGVWHVSFTKYDKDGNVKRNGKNSTVVKTVDELKRTLVKELELQAEYVM